MANILMITGDYAEDYEVMVPYQSAQILGHHICAVSPEKLAGETIKTAIYDFEGDHSYSEKPGHLFTLDSDFSTVSPDEFDVVLLPGGRAPQYLRLNVDVLDLIRAFLEAEKPMGSIGFGVLNLIAADAIAGKQVTAHATCAPDILNAGGTYRELPRGQAVIDGNLVTAADWYAVADWVRQINLLISDR